MTCNAGWTMQDSLSRVFNILGTAVGAWGVSADSDSAVFPAVNLEARIAKDKGLALSAHYFKLIGMARSPLWQPPSHAKLPKSPLSPTSSTSIKKKSRNY